MGGAIMRGALQEQLLEKENIVVKEHRQATCDALIEELGVEAYTELPDLKGFDMIIFAVKPQVLPDVLAEVKETGINPDTMLVSIAAGITLDTLAESVPSKHWYRAMPNIPVLVNKGFTAISSLEGEAPQILLDIFNALGEAVEVSELNLDHIAALGGAGTGFNRKNLPFGSDILLSRHPPNRLRAGLLQCQVPAACVAHPQPVLLNKTLTAPKNTSFTPHP